VGVAIYLNYSLQNGKPKEEANDNSISVMGYIVVPGISGWIQSLNNASEGQSNMEGGNSSTLY